MSQITKKLEAALNLALGIECLQADGLIPITRRSLQDAGGSQELAVDNQRIANALSVVALYAIVVELVVKHLWEDELGTTAKKTHDVRGLFKELRPMTRTSVRHLYDKCSAAYEEAVQHGQKQHGADVMSVKMATLEEALDWNNDAIRNFKYDLTPKGHSVPTGAIWNSELIWVVPNRFPNFAVELARWAKSQT